MENKNLMLRRKWRFIIFKLKLTVIEYDYLPVGSSLNAHSKPTIWSL